MNMVNLNCVCKLVVVRMSPYLSNKIVFMMHLFKRDLSFYASLGFGLRILAIKIVLIVVELSRALMCIMFSLTNECIYSDSSY